MWIDHAANMLASSMMQLIVSAIKHNTPDDVKECTVHTPFSTMGQSDWAEAVELWNRYGRELISSLPSRPCPACASLEKHRSIFESYDGYPYVECNQCGCWYVPLKVDGVLFERFFSSYPEAKDLCQAIFEKHLTDHDYEADLARFDGYMERIAPFFEGRSAPRSLDVGCGPGNSLAAAHKYGFEATGLELSQQCVEIARKSGLNVHHVSNPPPNHYDLITFWESLEHIDNPIEVLSSYSSMLAEDGLLAFSIPNLDSFLLRAQRSDCSVVHGGYNTPGHINLFGPSQVRLLLERAGFELLHLDGQYGMNLTEFMAYMLGKHRGASDLLNGRVTIEPFQASVMRMFQTIGPSISVLERLTLTAPILFGLACRKSKKQPFMQSIDHLEQRVKAELLLQVEHSFPEAQAHMDASLKISQLTEEVLKRGLEIEKTLHEVQIRDSLLEATQNEVNRRDELLASQAAEIDILRLEVLRQNAIIEKKSPD